MDSGSVCVAMSTHPQWRDPSMCDYDVDGGRCNMEMKSFTIGQANQMKAPIKSILYPLITFFTIHIHTHAPYFLFTLRVTVLSCERICHSSSLAYYRLNSSQKPGM
jgi:hypothetical protein